MIKAWIMSIILLPVSGLIIAKPLNSQSASKPESKAAATSVGFDPRHITTGLNIPSEGYADQPYIVKTG